MKLIAGFLFFLPAIISVGAEVDNYTAMTVELSDSSPQINNLINGYLQKAVDTANEASLETADKRCDLQDMMERLRLILNTNFPDVFNDINMDEAIEKTGSKEMEDTVYRSTKLRAQSLTYTININGSYVGIDKVDHFLSHGYSYYKASLSGKTEEQVLDIGQMQESGGWGLLGPKLKSYGDLAANYNGFLFWKEILGGENPFIECSHGKWKKVRTFQIQDYVDDSWNEAVNCSSYLNKETRDLANNNIKTKTKSGKLCPVKPKSCEKLKKKYRKNVASKILHPLCLGLQHNQVEAGGDDFGIVELFLSLQGVSMKNLIQGIGFGGETKGIK